MSRSDPNVDAVVVTYNRFYKLQNCLNAIRDQSWPVRHIHVVDNNSTDGTREWLRANADRYGLVLHLLDHNGGGAGGFNVGLREAYASGADWVWVMDDDVLPKPESLQALTMSPFFVAHIGGEKTVGFLSSRVEWTDGNVCLMNIPVPKWPWNDSFKEMRSSLPCVSNSFVSCMVSREGIDRVGLPIKEFFIWADDTEYTRRLSYHFSCYYVDDSVVVHDTPMNRLPTYSDVNRDNLWKYKCDIRNVAAFEARVGRKLDFFIAASYVLKNSLASFRANKDVRILGVLLREGIRGLFWNYKTLIERP